MPSEDTSCGTEKVAEVKGTMLSAGRPRRNVDLALRASMYFVAVCWETV
jgi:hypothetical protein